MLVHAQENLLSNIRIKGTKFCLQSFRVLSLKRNHIFFLFVEKGFPLQVTPTNHLSHQVQDALISQSPWALAIEMAMDTSEKERKNDEKVWYSIWIISNNHI